MCRFRPWMSFAAGLQFVVRIVLLSVTVGCSSLDDPPGGGQCLPHSEEQAQCDQAFTKCLGSKIQSIPSGTSGHSQCHTCRDLCMQNGGIWPDKALGRPCR